MTITQLAGSFDNDCVWAWGAVLQYGVIACIVNNLWSQDFLFFGRDEESEPISWCSLSFYYFKLKVKGESFRIIQHYHTSHAYEVQAGVSTKYLSSEIAVPQEPLCCNQAGPSEEHYLSQLEPSGAIIVPCELYRDTIQPQLVSVDATEVVVRLVPHDRTQNRPGHKYQRSCPGESRYRFKASRTSLRCSTSETPFHLPTNWFDLSQSS